MIPKYLEVFCIKKRISWSISRGGGYPSKACSWVQGVKDWVRGWASVVSVMAGGAGFEIVFPRQTPRVNHWCRGFASGRERPHLTSSSALSSFSAAVDRRFSSSSTPLSQHFPRIDTKKPRVRGNTDEKNSSERAGDRTLNQWLKRPLLYH